jgi:hypothetical protein
LGGDRFNKMQYFRKELSWRKIFSSLIEKAAKFGSSTALD